MSSYCEMVESNGNGKVLLATTDILPGFSVFTESEPILSFSRDFLWEYKEREEFAPFYAAYDILTSSSNPKNQQAFLNLFGPSTGCQAEEFRKNISSILIAYDDGSRRTFTEDEISLFIKVASVMRLNAFEYNGGRVVFEMATRMSHSCRPNCRLEFTGQNCLCRAILPIKAGEELTIEYNCQHRLKPTHERRRAYAETKDFTCHCPRCAAPADDTRQFLCFNPRCPGHHYICEPINDIPLTFSDCKYTGVLYRPPKVLPCTVCLQSPPPDHLQRMVRKEVHLDKLVRIAERDYLKLDVEDVEGRTKLLDELEALDYPVLHSSAIALNSLLLGVHRERYHLSGITSGLEKAASRLVASIDSMAGFPNEAWRDHLLAAAQGCMVVDSAQARVQAHDYAARALHMHLVLRGRDTGVSNCHHTLAEIGLLQERDKKGQQGSGVSMLQCAFCEETLTGAALVLRACARCQAVAYCSPNCQQAHWRLHKKTCVKL